MLVAYRKGDGGLLQAVHIKGTSWEPALIGTQEDKFQEQKKRDIIEHMKLLQLMMTQNLKYSYFFAQAPVQDSDPVWKHEVILYWVWP